MARLLADEHFDVQIVYKLRLLGHDVVTVREICTNKSGDAISDHGVLLEARRCRQSLLTKNVADFRVLHQDNPGHFGIIACSFSDSESPKSVAKRIDAEIRRARSLKGKWIRILAAPANQ